MKKVGTQIIIQARMSSTRLPGKTLMPLAGKPVIEHVVRRCHASLLTERVVVALPDAEIDDSLHQWCLDHQVHCVRGSTDDVLSRYIKALDAFPCRTLVRITADCPLVDPGIIDTLLTMHDSHNCHYTSNVEPPDFPKGFDVEAVNAQTLQEIAKISLSPAHREHVTLYLRENPQTFRTSNFSYRLGMPDLRLTLDTEADYQALQLIFDQLVQQHPLCSIYQILAFLQNNPQIMTINSGDIKLVRPQNHAEMSDLA